jgi:hypothetical protein
MAFLMGGVMPGLVPGIHVFDTNKNEDVDGRDKPCHDEVAWPALPHMLRDRLGKRPDLVEGTPSE